MKKGQALTISIILILLLLVLTFIALFLLFYPYVTYTAQVTQGNAASKKAQDSTNGQTPVIILDAPKAPTSSVHSSSQNPKVVLKTTRINGHLVRYVYYDNSDGTSSYEVVREYRDSEYLDWYLDRYSYRDRHWHDWEESTHHHEKPKENNESGDDTHYQEDEE